MEEVVDKLHLDMDYKELVRKIKVENPSDTRILNISALDPDAEMAKKIVDMTAKVASDYVGEIMEMRDRRLDKAPLFPVQDAGKGQCMLPSGLCGRVRIICIDEPTMSMLFTINNSPFFGKDGKYVIRWKKHSGVHCFYAVHLGHLEFFVISTRLITCWWQMLLF